VSNPIKKLLGQTAIYGLPSIVGRFLNFLLVPLYTSVFVNPAEYGVVSELYAWVAFLIVTLTFGMETAYFHFLQKREDKAEVFRSSFLSVLLVNGTFAISLLLLYQPIADAMLFSDHPEYIILLGVIVIIDAVSALPLAKLRAEEKALKFAAIQMTSIGFNIGLNLFFMLVLFNPEEPAEGVIFILIANLVSSLIKPIALYKDFIGIQFKVEIDFVKELVYYSFPLMIAGLAGIVNETIDRILLKHILYQGTVESLQYADEQVGIYSACYKLAMLVTIFLQAYRYAAEPFFFARSKDLDRDKQYRKIMNYFVAAVCAVFLLVSLNIDFFKGFIRNEAYHVGLHVVPILLLANVFLGIYFNQSIWYKLSGQTKFGAFIAIGGAIITIVINVLFIPIYGFTASAWATLVVYASQMIASYLLSRKYYPIKYNLRKFFLYLGVAILFFFIGKSIDFESVIINYTLKNILLLGFVFLVYKLENPFAKTA
jgi:O-antigen/teichoic acid export membrane protein|tara:strand:+ start:19430 stop:20881 length:1452 start_codon:yes stop_codon:yes gene_type:complete